MDLATSLKLAFVRPDEWQIDLTPPTREDVWTGPSITDIATSIGSSFHEMARIFTLPFIQMGQSIGKAATTTALTDHSPGTISGMNLSGSALTYEQIIEVAKRFGEAQTALKPVIPVAEALSQAEEERNGTHTVKPYKMGDKLSHRKTNTGPPVNLFKKRGRR